MENEKRDESIFEQENYQGGFGSGPLAAAPDEEDSDADFSDEDDAEPEDTAGADTIDS